MENEDVVQQVAQENKQDFGGMEAFGAGNDIDKMLDEATDVTTKPKQESDPNAQQGEDNTAEKAVPVQPDPGLIKIGEHEYTPDEWLAAISDRQNKKKWVEINTKKGQLFNSKYVTPENIEMVLPYAIGNKALPGDFAKALKSELPEEFEIELEDEYGETIRHIVKRDKILTKDILNQIKNGIVKEYFPEYSELKEKSVKFEELNQKYQQDMELSGDQNFRAYIKGKKAIEITVPEGKTYKEMATAILQAGEDHPEYGNALRGLDLLETAVRFQQPIDRVYKEKFSMFDQAEKVKTVIVDNQKKMISEKPGERMMEKSEDEQFFDAIKGSHSAAVGRLFSNKS